MFALALACALCTQPADLPDSGAGRTTDAGSSAAGQLVPPLRIVRADLGIADDRRLGGGDGEEEKPHKYPLLAAALNFFFAGPGYIYNGRRTLTGIGLTIAAAVLTYVELRLRTENPQLYPYMFGAAFTLNTFLAIDGYREASAINEGRAY